MSGRTSDKLGAVGLSVLAIEVVFAGLALGSLHTVVLAVTATLACVAVFCLWFSAAPLRARPAATTLVTLAVVLLGFTALQAVPMPASLVGAVAPENADVWSRALAPLREAGPSFVTVSLDPTATRIEVLRGITYLLTFLAALRAAQRQDGVVLLERIIVGASVAMAVAALLHPAFGAQRVFGAYEPVAKYAFAPKNLAPLLNTNHLAAYVNVGFCVAFGSLLRRHEAAIPRPIAAAAAAVLVATNLWARSRGGAATMLLGALLVAGVSLFVRRKDRGQALLVVAPSVGVIAAAAMVALAWSDDARSKLQSTNLTKLQIPVQALELAKKSAITGFGRGSFESVFPSVRQGFGHWVFTHPENVLAQWTVEWGVPVALLAFGAMIWALRPASMLARSHPPIGAWAALIVVAAQNLVDFSSEVPGVVVLGTVCAGIVVGGTAGRERSSRIEFWSSRPRALAFASVGLLVAGVVATVPFVDHELGNEQRRFEAMGVDKTLGKAAFDVQARTTMLRHPAEPYFPFIGALRATVVRDDSVLTWAAHALERSPVNGRTHLLLARNLWRTHAAQARLEYRLAVEQDTNLIGIVAEEVPPLVGSEEDAMELVPAGLGSAEVLESIVKAVSKRLPATAVRLDREIVARHPKSITPLERAAAFALADVRDAAPWCGPGGGDCFVAGVDAARRVKDAAPERCEGHVLLAQLEIAAGRAGQGLSQLEGAIDTAADKSGCARALVQLAQEAGQKVRVDAALERLTHLGCNLSSECVDNIVYAAEIERQRGNGRRALALYKNAAERAPERDDLLETVAQLATSVGLPGEALDAYARLAQRHPDEPRFAEAVTRAKEAVQRNLARHLSDTTR